MISVSGCADAFSRIAMCEPGSRIAMCEPALGIFTEAAHVDDLSEALR